MQSLILQDLITRLRAATLTGLNPKHFEPEGLPVIPTEIDAVIGGKRFILKGRCYLSGTDSQWQIDFPDSIPDSQCYEWFNQCKTRLIDMLFSKLEL